MEGFTDLPVTLYSDGRLETGSEPVVEEYTLTLHVNDVPFTTFLCTKRDLNLLVVGYLLTEGAIVSANEIKMLSVNETRGAASVWLRDGPQAERSLIRPPKRPLDLNVVLDYMAEFRAHAECARTEHTLFPHGGGVHGAALCAQHELVLYHEDLGRHNAVDKVIGDAALRELDTSGMALLTSGRPSSALLQKAAACRAALVASSAVPTRQAVQIARKRGIALIGAVDGRKCVVYCS
ncbi:MAG: formate dehydrogenase accessory sulfurtransferase FdhD [Oscillospiraceae bacterium]|nr:formate dehydrogenase accessory sulfurtransferase FdhD [Oscillospiraceae bacterium]